MASPTRAITHSRRKILQFGLSAAFVPMAPAFVRAQASDLPSGPIRVILPTLHGGQADTLGRLIGDRVGTAIERNFVMEPRAGAGGLIAGEYVARAVPDGNTLLFVTGGHTTLPGLYARTIKFDAVKDFAFVCQISEFELRHRSPARSSREVVRPSAGRVEAKSGKDHVQQHRGGFNPASDRRGLPGAIRREVDARALSGRRGTDQRRDRRACRHGDQLHAHDCPAGERRENAGAGGVLNGPRSAAARHAVVRGNLAGLLRRDDPRSRRAGADAAADRRAPQPRDCQSCEDRRHAGAAGDMANKAIGGTPEEFTTTVAQYVERWTGVIKSSELPGNPLLADRLWGT